MIYISVNTKNAMWDNIKAVIRAIIIVCDVIHITCRPTIAANKNFYVEKKTSKIWKCDLESTFYGLSITAVFHLRRSRVVNVMDIPVFYKIKIN